MDASWETSGKTRAYSCITYITHSLMLLLPDKGILRKERVSERLLKEPYRRSSFSVFLLSRSSCDPLRSSSAEFSYILA